MQTLAICIMGISIGACFLALCRAADVVEDYEEALRDLESSGRGYIATDVLKKHEAKTSEDLWEDEEDERET